MLNDEGAEQLENFQVLAQRRARLRVAASCGLDLQGGSCVEEVPLRRAL